MNRILINATQPEEVRVALVDSKGLVDIDVEKSGQANKKSDIFKGTISRVEPSLGAAFVNYGGKKQGFLPLKEIPYCYLSESTDSKKHIKDRIKEGQEIIVQIDKIERGNKGAALSSNISLAGCYVVYMPNRARSGGISRRVEGTERTELKNIYQQISTPKSGGIIIRTAAIGKDIKDIQYDLSVQIEKWDQIQQEYSSKRSPSLLFQDSDVIIRSIRDALHNNVEEIIVDSTDAYIKTKSYIEKYRPDFIKKIKMFNSSIPLFSKFNLEKQIEKAHLREVTLPSGGSIIIDHTEALISIDINSAKATAGEDIEETALNTNIEAAIEITVQLKIRDLGGLIVIDFIDMLSSKNQKIVENTLTDYFKKDKAKIRVGRISRFGLLELSRQRLKPALSEFSQIKCTRCDGTGSIRHISSLSLSIIRLIEESALNEGTSHVVCLLPVEVATFVLNEKRYNITSIEKKLDVQLIIVPSKDIHPPFYKIHSIKNASNISDTYSFQHLTKQDVNKIEISSSYERDFKHVNKINKTKKKGFLSRFIGNFINIFR